MKRILTFEFDHADDDDFLIVSHALIFREAINELSDFLRSKTKYDIDRSLDLPQAKDLEGLSEDDIKTAIAQHVFQVCRDKLWEAINEGGV